MSATRDDASRATEAPHIDSIIETRVGTAGASAQAATLIPDTIVEDDHGRFQVGLHDEAGSFPTRRFASAVAARKVTRESA